MLHTLENYVHVFDHFQLWIFHIMYTKAQVSTRFQLNASNVQYFERNVFYFGWENEIRRLQRENRICAIIIVHLAVKMGTKKRF